VGKAQRGGPEGGWHQHHHRNNNDDGTSANHHFTRAAGAAQAGGERQARGTGQEPVAIGPVRRRTGRGASCSWWI
jgi:hypothetical protein